MLLFIPLLFFLDFLPRWVKCTPVVSEPAVLYANQMPAQGLSGAAWPQGVRGDTTRAAETLLWSPALSTAVLVEIMWDLHP